MARNLNEEPAAFAQPEEPTGDRPSLPDPVQLPETSVENAPNSTGGPTLALDVQVVDFLSSYAISGVLEGFTPGEVSVTVKEPLTEQREVTVHAEYFVFDGKILYCRPREAGYEAHITIDDVGKTGLRRAPRFPVKLKAQLFPPYAAPVDITIVDIASDGLGIELPVSVEMGQPIAVLTGPVFIFGVVRHCRKRPDGVFRAGVEMHHLFEKAVEAPREESAPPPFLRRVSQLCSKLRLVKGDGKRG